LPLIIVDEVQDLSPEFTDHAVERLVRRLSGRYLFVLLTVAGLVAANQAVIQPLLMRLNVFAPVINIAGRQRMLSQKIAKAALAMNAADAEESVDRERELSDALAEWTAGHTELRSGKPHGEAALIQSEELAIAWEELQVDFDAMKRAATSLVESPSRGDRKQTNALIAVLVEHEAPFLRKMDRIVNLMEQQAAIELDHLRLVALGISLAIIALLVGVGVFVVRPATRTIRSQVDQLEERVALRTRELDHTLASLRNEVHEREASEARNRHLASQLAHADRVESLGRLAAGLAHELNQPLGAIVNYAEACDATLSAPWGEASQSRLKEFVQQMQRASLRAGSIIRRIRNFVRPGMVDSAEADMTALVAEVVELCRPEADSVEVELSANLPGEALPVVGDAIQIQQVLVNLIQNALQAMVNAPPQRRRLLIRMTSANGGVQVDVVDSGSGLANVDPETLFAPFHTTKDEGLGIGLSICRSIIEQHQGTIWAKSLPEVGAQFSFVLPLSTQRDVQPVL
jgi:two-component system sensor kinase FixL